MNTQDLINYYANLLILQYLQEPKAFANIQTVVSPVIMDQLPDDVQNAFAIGTATGVQLDVLGKYAGVSRMGNGINGPITLDDADFTSLIKIAIITNSSGSSLATIQQLLNEFFPGQLFVFDFLDMRMGYFMSSAVGSLDLVQIFINEGLLPKPMGVLLSSLIYVPTLDNIFAYRTYSNQPANISGYSSYASYPTDHPWLSYSDTIVII